MIFLSLKVCCCQFSHSAWMINWKKVFKNGTEEEMQSRKTIIKIITFQHKKMHVTLLWEMFLFYVEALACYFVYYFIFYFYDSMLRIKGSLIGIVLGCFFYYIVLSVCLLGVFVGVFVHLFCLSFVVGLSVVTSILLFWINFMVCVVSITNLLKIGTNFKVKTLDYCFVCTSCIIVLNLY